MKKDTFQIKQERKQNKTKQNKNIVNSLFMRFCIVILAVSLIFMLILDVTNALSMNDCHVFQYLYVCNPLWCSW